MMLQFVSGSWSTSDPRWPEDRQGRGLLLHFFFLSLSIAANAARFYLFVHRADVTWFLFSSGSSGFTGFCLLLWFMQ